jgi:hypothetical protein
MEVPTYSKALPTPVKAVPAAPHVATVRDFVCCKSKNIDKTKCTFIIGLVNFLA